VWQFKLGELKAEWSPKPGKGHTQPIACILYSLLFAPLGGMLFHASSAIRDGHGFVFSGVSGVGKSTIARLAPADVTVLGEEATDVRADGNGDYRLFGGRTARTQAREVVSAPLKALYMLSHGPDNRCEPLPYNEAVRAVLRNILLLGEAPELSRLFFESACLLARRTPVYRLTFVPTQKIWEMIS
jgi:hypothetical protein